MTLRCLADIADRLQVQIKKTGESLKMALISGDIKVAGGSNPIAPNFIILNLLHVYIRYFSGINCLYHPVVIPYQ